ncbi:hypothetical protein BB561_006294 [Smittium simulii]|uniref:Uncharacterized protein n=1 Tax=Smittium simulii TaxID=133385 RepID=A0A2T9Y5I4_9FUNG|nr:hypothetical protein BB561_006294 [Smittium simulii]
MGEQKKAKFKTLDVDSNCVNFQKSRKNILFNPETIFEQKNNNLSKKKSRLLEPPLNTVDNNIDQQKHKQPKLPEKCEKLHRTDIQKNSTQSPKYLENSIISEQKYHTPYEAAFLDLSFKEPLCKNSLNLNVNKFRVLDTKKNSDSNLGLNYQNFDSPKDADMSIDNKLEFLQRLEPVYKKKYGPSNFARDQVTNHSNFLVQDQSLEKKIDDPVPDNTHCNDIFETSDYINFSEDELFENNQNDNFSSAYNQEKLLRANYGHNYSDRLCFKEKTIIPYKYTQRHTKSSNDSLVYTWKSAHEMIRSNQNILMHSLEFNADILSKNAGNGSKINRNKSLSSQTAPDWKFSISSANFFLDGYGCLKVYAIIQKYPKKKLDTDTKKLIANGDIKTAIIYISLCPFEEFPDSNQNFFKIFNSGRFTENTDTICCKCNTQCSNWYAKILENTLNGVGEPAKNTASTFSETSQCLSLNIYSDWSYYIVPSNSSSLFNCINRKFGKCSYYDSFKNPGNISTSLNESTNFDKYFENVENKSCLLITSANFTISSS